MKPTLRLLWCSLVLLPLSGCGSSQPTGVGGPPPGMPPGMRPPGGIQGGMPGGPPPGVGGPGMPDPIAMKTAFDALKPMPLTDDKGDAIGFALTGPQVTDDNILVVLPALNQMKRISFTNAAITNATFKALGKLNNLEELDFASTTVTAEDLKELSALPQLARLEFVSTGLTGSALKVLATFNHLKELKIAKEDLSDAAVAELKGALPACNVEVTK